MLNAETVLSDTFPEQKCLELKTSLLARQRGTQSSLDRLRALLRLIQGDQMLQVTMTTTIVSFTEMGMIILEFLGGLCSQISVSVGVEPADMEG